MNFFGKSILLAAILAAVAFSADAQLKRRAQVNSAKETALEPVPAKTPVKKNDRPPTETGSAPNKNQPEKTPEIAGDESKSPYRYEFTQPNFIVRHIIIEHDENGSGQIIFEKKDAEESVTDPLQISKASLEKINNLLSTLNFVESTENYQSPTRDYQHLGNYEITVKKDGKTRTAKYNWSENAEARALSAEYRKLGEQAVWLFDMTVARQNQPLEAPGLMDRLDSLLKRDEISDPPQLISALKDFSTDERLPLMARNRAARIIKSIESKNFSTPVNK